MKNCLICIVDCLRYDGIEALPSDGGTLSNYNLKSQLDTPNMNRIVETGSQIPFLHAPYGSTPSSSASILTGLYPREHGAYDFFRPMRDDTATLADYFKKDGFHTIMMNGHFFFGKMGLRKRFDEVIQGPVQRLIQRIKELNEDGKRVFAYFHTMDVHPPYLISKFPPTINYNDKAIQIANTIAETFNESMHFDRSDLHVKDESRDLDFMASTELPVWRFMKENVIKHHKRDVDIFDDPVKELAKLYVMGINHFDKGQFGTLADFILDDPVGKETCFVLSSDHGQISKKTDTGKQTFYHQGKPLEELIRVPGVIVSRNEDLNNIEESKISSLVDLAPTLMDLFGLSESGEDLSGVNLLKAENKRNYIYADSCHSIYFSDSDVPLSERGFPLPGVLEWSSLITIEGDKYYTDSIPITLEDFNLSEELFVRVVEEKLFNKWLPKNDLKQRLGQLESSMEGYNNYLSEKQETKPQPQKELYDLTKFPLEEKQIDLNEDNDDLIEEYDQHLAKRFPTASELTKNGSSKDHDSEADTQAPLEGFGYL